MMNVIMLIVIMMSVDMLSVVKLNDMAPNWPPIQLRSREGRIPAPFTYTNKIRVIDKRVIKDQSNLSHWDKTENGRSYSYGNGYLSMGLWLLIRLREHLWQIVMASSVSTCTATDVDSATATNGATATATMRLYGYATYVSTAKGTDVANFKQWLQ